MQTPAETAPQIIGRLNPQMRNRVEYTVDAESVKAMDGKMVACIGLDVYGPFDSHEEIEAWKKAKFTATPC